MLKFATQQGGFDELRDRSWEMIWGILLQSCAESCLPTTARVQRSSRLKMMLQWGLLRALALSPAAGEHSRAVPERSEGRTEGCVRLSLALRAAVSVSVAWFEKQFCPRGQMLGLRVQLKWYEVYCQE